MLFRSAESAELALDPKRLAYVHLIRGSLTVSGHAISGGDALLIQNEDRLKFEAGEDAEVLFFELTP